MHAVTTDSPRPVAAAVHAELVTFHTAFAGSTSSLLKGSGVTGRRRRRRPAELRVQQQPNAGARFQQGAADGSQTLPSRSHQRAAGPGRGRAALLGGGKGNAGGRKGARKRGVSADQVGVLVRKNGRSCFAY